MEEEPHSHAERSLPEARNSTLALIAKKTIPSVATAFHLRSHQSARWPTRPQECILLGSWPSVGNRVHPKGQGPSAGGFVPRILSKFMCSEEDLGVLFPHTRCDLGSTLCEEQ